ncbi:MAG TPA: LLM class flavin-dependent oxidoreductase [Myxococcota bacterium]|jgi:alkanesulfonate monooxygenase SsuD/methylene tetrahydromethanopterin reductase-like flavin-dependent oxidoreductase (luciferase family)|nr:LLM class flavin-dependent oxidoreductase [Myxococcota bacterium]
MPMQFALFYEIPVARPWSDESEHRAYKHTLEQAIAAERWGWDAFWSVEHHFLEEYSHCSNPEVLYGAIASRTSRLRLGYGVRLMPQPYNHPVRTAESVAVLDLLSDGRVDFGTGRSSTRPELEGFGIDPHQTREMWQEAIEHVVGCWTNDEYAFEGRHWRMPRRRVLPKPLQRPHPPIWGATSSEEGHRQMGELGLGLCSFAVGVPPEEVKKKIDVYRAAISGCRRPLGRWVHDRAATFTMTLCAPTEAEARDVARESFEWYPKAGARLIASLAGWMAEEKRGLGNYAYAADLRAVDESGALELLTLDYLVGAGACALGTPAQCLEACRRYEAAGVDLLLCLVNPYKIPHDKVMQTIELMGRHVIPQFRA